MAMSEEHRNKLRDNYDRLVSELEIGEELLAALRKDNILTADMQEAVQCEKTRRGQARKLVDTLMRRGRNAFERFIEALCETGETEIAEALDPVLCQKYRTDDYEEDETDVPAKKSSLDLTQIDKTDFQVKVEPMSPDAKKKRSDSNRAYVLHDNDRPFGRAYIIGFEKDKDNSLGVTNDVKLLESLFKQLNFSTRMELNLTSSELLSALQMEANDQHSKSSALVLCILSYGSRNDEVQCRDGTSMKIKDIISLFEGGKCPLLREKPKIFLIHTGEPMSGKHGGHSTTGQPMEVDQHDGAVTTVKQQTTMNVHDKGDVYTILSTSDVWRDKMRGSWFIRCVALTIASYAKDLHLEDIMTKVDSCIKQQKDRGTPFQNPERRTTLRKDFYFMT